MKSRRRLPGQSENTESRVSPPIVKPDIMFIEDLLNGLQAGTICIPRIQRPFVWKPEDIRALFDSIKRGYPIGNLLLWETDEVVSTTRKIGPFSAPNPAQGKVSYVLDGHQRLSTLWGVLRLPNDYLMDDKQSNWRWWLWYDPEKDEFVHRPKADPVQYFVPMSSMMKTMGLLRYAREVSRRFPDQAEQYISIAETTAEAILKYRVSVTRIVGGSLEDAVEIFSRLNTRGTPLTSDHLIAALTYKENEFNLAERIDDIMESMAAFHLDGVKRKYIFQTVAAAAGIRVGRRAAVPSFKKLLTKTLSDDVDKAEQSLITAAEFLRDELGVCSHRLLPDSYQLVMLAEFFHHCQTPDGTQKKTLKQWFWATSLSGWFAGARPEALDRGLQEMATFAHKPTTTTDHFRAMPLDDPAKPFPRRFDGRGARVRALMLMMVSRRPPKNLAGKPIDVSALLSKQGGTAVPYIFKRDVGDWMSSPGNRIMLERAPGTSMVKQLQGIAPDKRSEVLHSHWIPEEAYDALLSEDGARFIQLRAAYIEDEERQFIADLGLQPSTETSSPDDEPDIDADE